MKLELDHVSVSLGGQSVLRELTLPPTNFRTLALVGPSGGGKSTLLRVLGGLRVPDEGAVRIADRPVPRLEPALRAHRRRVGMVFQNWNLFHHLTALENMTLPLVQVQGVPRDEAAERAHALLRRFGLAGHAHKKPRQLSGGQQQRVAILRARALRPDLMLLDEPTSALDPVMAAQVLELVGEMTREGLPVILVTHHLAFARRSADHMGYLAEGRLKAHGPVDAFFEDPGLPECRRFLETVLQL